MIKNWLERIVVALLGIVISISAYGEICEGTKCITQYNPQMDLTITTTALEVHKYWYVDIEVPEGMVASVTVRESPNCNQNHASPAAAGYRDINGQIYGPGNFSISQGYGPEEYVKPGKYSYLSPLNGKRGLRVGQVVTTVAIMLLRNLEYWLHIVN